MDIENENVIVSEIKVDSGYVKRVNAPQGRAHRIRKIKSCYHGSR